MANQYALDPRDHAKYGGPEWVTYDSAKLDDMPFDQIDRWEREMGHSVAQIVGRELPRASAVGIKGIVWLSRQLAGQTEPKFAEFNIRPRLVRHRLEPGADADPPASDSSESSPGSAA